MKRNYLVTLTVAADHEFHIPDCNTPEEAESIAEGMLSEGEPGEVTDMEVIDTSTVEYEEEN